MKPNFTFPLLLVCCAVLQGGRPSLGQDASQTEKMTWGKAVNGLAVAIEPTIANPSKTVIRWKNVGKETLELPWVRFESNAAYRYKDDLLDHVFLKGPDGKLVPARKYQHPIIGGPPYRPRTVTLAPGKVHQETVDLWAYVSKPAMAGTYQLWIEPEIKGSYAPSQPGAKFWNGKIRSNTVDVKLAE